MIRLWRDCFCFAQVVNGTASITVNVDYVRSCNNSPLTSDIVADVLYSNSAVLASDSNDLLPVIGIGITTTSNYTCARVVFKANSTTLPFLNNSKSYLNIVPKCGQGFFVSSDPSGNFSCMQCPSGTFADTNDARLCRCQFKQHCYLLFLIQRFAETAQLDSRPI